MNQQKIGMFLKELRKQKGITQEQFAEIMNVSGRTVSRWETGSNMPDLDVLILISEFYEVDLRSLLDGERKNEAMDKETKETVIKTADYTNTETVRYTKKIHRLLSVGAILWFAAQVISHTSLSDIKALSIISDFCSGGSIGLVICGIFATSSYGQRLKSFKRRIMKLQ